MAKVVLEPIRGTTCLKALTSLRTPTRPSSVDVSCSDVEDLFCHTAFASQVYILNAMGCKISKLDSLQLFKELRELNLEKNRLREFQPDYMNLPNMRKLVISGNLLENRLSLSAFPILAELHIDDIGLESLEIVKKLPKSIKIFNAKNNKLKDLTEASYLLHFENLEELDLSGNPCLEGLDDLTAVIALKALAFALLNKINGIQLNSDTHLRAENLQLVGIGKFKPGMNMHRQLIEFIQAKSVKYRPPGTPATPRSLKKYSQSVSSAPNLLAANRRFFKDEDATPVRSPFTLRISKTNIDSGRPESSFTSSSTILEDPVTPKANQQYNYHKRSPRSQTPENSLAGELGDLELGTYDGDESFASTNTVTISRGDQLTGSRIMGFEEPYASFARPSIVSPSYNTTRVVFVRDRRTKRRTSSTMFQLWKRLNRKTELLESKLVNKNTQFDNLEKRVWELEKENMGLKEFIQDQLQLVPTDVRVKPHDKNNFLLEWTNAPKFTLSHNVARHELEMNGSVFTVKGHNQKALISDPREQERIGIRTVQKSTGKKSETTTVVFTKALFRDHKENKENLNSIS